MLSFENDYSEGAHEEILKRLAEINRQQQPGYGNDPICAQAKEKIRAACGCPQADIFFLVGGTQTNAVVIDSLLRPYEGVLAAESGHVAVHEAGAIEAGGHKVLTLPGREGRLEAADLRAYLERFYGDGTYEHMVQPGMVYISHPTELGTLYTRAGLEALAQVCREYKLPLYLDGARLGYGLESPGTDVGLEDLGRLCDAFYIGGTKVGALFGEAVVFPQGNMPPHFLTLVKQHGALLAKGWLLGVQFDALFTDNLYRRISRQAIETAGLLREGLRKKGIPFYLETPGNQIFVVLENEILERLKGRAAVSVWEKTDAGHAAVRLSTSWATCPEQVEEFLRLL